jgi:GNAT superfamily N-acetyltransferase
MAATEPAARPLTAGDLDDLGALVAEAGWNQTAQDWERMLALGTGRGVTDGTGRVIASAVTMPYAGVGWIGMVLVAGAWRRRGIATGLLDWAVSTLRDAGLTPGLDATPAGQEVYRRLGFRGTLALTRWRRQGFDASPSEPGPEPATVADLAWIAALDARAFGAGRRELLARWLADNAPGWTAGRSGFLLRRAGRTACHLGPLCAEDAATAERLLAGALRAEPGPLLIDVPDAHPDIEEVLARAGFAPERPFLRMFLGAPVPRCASDALYAIAGPELG